MLYCFVTLVRLSLVTNKGYLLTYLLTYLVVSTDDFHATYFEVRSFCL